MSHRRVRPLKVGADTYWRSSGHSHTSGVPDGCREVVWIARAETPGRGLRVTFAPGPDRLVSGGFFSHDGLVCRMDGDDHLNLHLPSVVRAILDEAVERGWDTRTALELDGWDLFDAVLARLPSVPPSVPPSGASSGASSGSGTEAEAGTQG